MLTAYKGKLLSKSHKGNSVYAGCFLRKRHIILEEQMLRTPAVLRRIFVHEVFHFVWSKLRPAVRDSYAALISAELERGAAGELGWSAESIKLKLTDEDRALGNQRWRNYLCESFCDTGGWYFARAYTYSERTLGRVERQLRRAWIRENLRGYELAI